MRLGVGLDLSTEDPDEMARQYVQAGYGAAVCPPVSLEQPDRMRQIQTAFARRDVLLAEIGVWNNMLAADPAQRAANLQANVNSLSIAEEMGIPCCVNIAGSFHPTYWDGPHARNLTDEAFEAVVENVRYVIDAVKPKRSKFCIETMPWAVPDSPNSYLKLVASVSREAFGVHLDPVNWINSPERYFNNATMLKESFDLLGKWIVSCHAKDISLDRRLTVHLDEVRPGLGNLDYALYLRLLARLPENISLIIEHLPQSEYALARDHILEVAVKTGVSFHHPAGLAQP